MAQKHQATARKPISTGRYVDNTVYDRLGERWYSAADDPIALLRAESKLRARYLVSRLKWYYKPQNCALLDIGCGGGFLSNSLARQGFAVTGIDTSLESLNVAHSHDTTRSVQYMTGDAYELPFPGGSFDSVLAMDFLEHVERPDKVIAEAARVLRPGGLFFFHTFNRTWISNLLVVKGMEWFIKNTPKHLHLHELFLTPNEVLAYCNQEGMAVQEIVGSRPVILSRAFFRTLLTGKVDPNFRFQLTKSRAISYLGFAQRY